MLSGCIPRGATVGGLVFSWVGPVRCCRTRAGFGWFPLFASGVCLFFVVASCVFVCANSTH